MNIFSNCPAAQKSFALYNDDTIRPCCVWRGPTKNASINDVLDEYNKQKFDIETACKKCIAQEQIGIKSRRNTIVERTKKYNFFYDLSLSNVCNLACTMCNSLNSSKWVKIEKEVFNEQDVYVSAHQIDHNRLDEVIEHINIKSKDSKVAIEIKGGEPLIQPEVMKLVDRLKNKKNVALFFVSNLTVLDDWFTGSIKHFNKIKIYASFEGVGDTYNYIRAGADFTNFEQNLSILKKLPVEWSFSPLILNYNIGDLFAVKDFMLTHKGSIDEQLLYGPAQLNISHLPKKAQKYLNIPDDMVRTKQFLCSQSDEKQWKNFIDYTNKLDSFHKKDFWQTPTGKILEKIID